MHANQHGGVRNQVATHTTVRLCAVLLCVALGLGISAPTTRTNSGTTPDAKTTPVIVTTTPLLADIVRNIGGDNVDVTSLVPLGGDPEKYEPTLRDARYITTADLTLSHYPLFENAALLRAVSPSGTDAPRHVSVTQELVRYSARFITRIEDPTLDAVWLGFSSPTRDTASPDEARQWISVTNVNGPGDLVGYVRGALGTATVLFSSLDGFDKATGFEADTLAVPPGAHHHVSWIFTEPGIYEVELRAQHSKNKTARPDTVGQATLVLAVGVPAHDAPNQRTPISGGHADISVGETGQGLVLAVADEEDAGHDHTDHSHASMSLDDVVITVPPHTLTPADIQTDSGDLFPPGTSVYQLPQAVLGRSIHGEIDPALWLDPTNVVALASLVCDELVRLDPSGSAEYHSALELYSHKIHRTDRYASARMSSIADSDRYLVTEFDTVRYLAGAYNLTIAGTAVPRRGIDPSLTHRRSVLQSITGHTVRAVFAEEDPLGGESLLTDIARQTDTRVCHLVTGAGLTRDHPTILDAMTYNADTIARCLADQ